MKSLSITKNIFTPESLTSTISGSIWILMIPSVTFHIKLEKLAFYNGQVFDTQYLIFWKDDRDYTYTLTPSSLQINNNIFDVKKKKSKDYYSLLVMKKSQPPNIVHKWKSDLEGNLSFYLTLLLLNPMLRLFSIKSSTIYSTQTWNCVKLALELMIYALSAKLGEKCSQKEKIKLSVS